MDDTNKRGAEIGQRGSRSGGARPSLRAHGMDAAIAYLERQGYVISDEGWSCDAGRIDLVAWERLGIVFVEVTVHTSRAKRSEPKALSRVKTRRLERMAAAWFAEKDLAVQPVRFDTIEIIALSHDEAILRHSRGADVIAP